MSWLSSLFKGKKTTQPDTSVQEAEAQRQSALEQQRLQAMLDQQQKMWEQQRTDDNTRYQQQLTAQQAEAERQRQAQDAQIKQQTQLQQSQLADQQRQRQEADTKAEAERQAQEARAAEQARLARDYATGRQTLIDKAKTDVGTAYSGFNDQAYGDFAQSFVNYYKPQAERSYRDARDQATFGFGDSGNLRSSAAAKSFGDLVQQLHGNEGKIANSATDAAQQYRDQIEQQKSSALGLINSAVSGTANPNLPDGFNDTDVSTALAGISSQLGGITSSAASRAQAAKPPSFASTNLDLAMKVKKPTGTTVIA